MSDLGELNRKLDLCLDALEVLLNIYTDREANVLHLPADGTSGETLTTKEARRVLESIAILKHFG